MRLRGLILAIVLPLSACQGTGLPFGSPGGDIDAVVPDPTEPAYVATEDDPELSGTASADDEADQNDDDAPGVDDSDPPVVETPPPDPNAAARAACLKKRDIFSRTETGAFVCVSRTKDGAKSCTASTQCEGLCLARSRTCSPVTPLIGCHEILSNTGVRSTVCTN